MSLRLAIVGSTGAVGRELLRILESSRFPVAALDLFASRSSGRTARFRGREVSIRAVDGPELGQSDLAFLCAGAQVSRALIPQLLSSGSLIVDNSSAYRMEEGVPLVVPEVNGELLVSRPALTANPNCTTIITMMSLAPLHRAFGLERVVLSSYQAVSGAGRQALEALRTGTAAVLAGRRPEDEGSQESIAMNYISAIGEIDEDGWSHEENKVEQETRKILELPELPVTATCVRVPVPTCHGVSATAWFESPVDVTAAREVLAAAPGVVLDPVPTAARYEDRDEVGCGRIRAVRGSDRALTWFTVGNQLRKGAALNAVQIAERLLGNGPVP